MPASTRTALQLALALTTALAAGHLLFGPHWQWCAISAMVVNLGTAGRGDLALKGIERGLGAMAGTIAAAILAAWVQPRGTACIVVIFIVLALASALRRHGYAFYAGGITMVLSLLYGYFGESAQDLLLIRLQALALGAAIAVATGWFLLPVRAGDVLRARLATALAALSALLEARRTGAGAPAALAAFDAAADDVRASTRPYRLHRAVLRLARAPRAAAHPAEAGDALLDARAVAVADPAPHRRATAATTIALLRRALADPAASLPDLPESARQGPPGGLDAALLQMARAIPALRPRTAHGPAGTPRAQTRPAGPSA
jgi:uncharacterized membrane protein YccC